MVTRKQEEFDLVKDHNGVASENTNDEKRQEADDDIGDPLFWGIGPCRPPGMQFCVSMGYFSCIYSISGMFTSSLTIYINSQITTLEKQFGFSSSVSGIIMSCNDIGYLMTTLFMSYITRRTHIPRVLMLSTVFYGISGIICSIPHFVTKDELYPLQDLNSSTMNQSESHMGQLCSQRSENVLNSSGMPPCMENMSGPIADISDSTRSFALVVIAVGMILQGVGKAPRQPFLSTYIDDNVEKTKTALYMGLIVGFSIIGPSIGFILGGLFSQVHVTLQDTEMTPSDPRWIGAWWLGFLVFGGCAIVGGLPLMFFPRRIKPMDKEVAREEERRRKSAWHDMKNMVKSLFRLVTTPIYILMVIGNCLTLFTLSGMLAFLPKYLETQFFLPVWKANILLGGLNGIASVTGTIVGGVMTSKLKLHPSSCLKVIIVITIASIFLQGSGFFFGCPQPNLNMKSTLTSGQNKTTFCAETCGCDDKGFFPICGSDGMNYFSPCHAGCSSATEQGYFNCTCVSETKANPSAVPGLCETDCMMVYPLITAYGIMGLIGSVQMMPSFIIIIRSVPEIDKPLAVGFSAFLTTLLGWFPGPVVFGRIVDSTCLIWSRKCTGKGFCSLYDIVSFRYHFHSLSVGFRLLTLCSICLAFLIALRKKKPFYMDNESNKAAGEALLDTNEDREMTVVNK